MSLIRSLSVIFSILTVICSQQAAFSQENDNYELLGTLELLDGSLITYKLSFSIDENNNISGKSITDFLGEEKTSTLIEGAVMDNGEEITFRETDNIATSSSYADSSFCYIHLKKGLIKLKGKKTIIQGHFNSYFPDGSPCIEGDLYLIGQDVILNKLKRTRLFLGEENREMVDGIITASEEEDMGPILTDGTNVSVRSDAKTIELVIWDDQYFDEDRLTIEVNGEAFIVDHIVRKEPATFRIDLSKGMNDLRIISTSEGEAPPNTAMIKVLVDDEELIYKANLKNAEIASFSVVH